MVKLLTDYFTQIYHALSTDARPAANPGDQLREIDTGKRFIFDGGTWQELPEGSGGGGGGGPDDLVLLKKGTYTAATNPNPLTIPVSYTGTPILAIVEAANRATGYSQELFAVRLSQPNTVNPWWCDRNYVLQHGQSDSNSDTFNSPNYSLLPSFVVDNTQLKFPRQDSTRIWRSGDYNWYIWGYAT